MLSADSIKRFQEIYRNEFGVDLTLEEATEQAERLLNLTRIVMQPMPKQYLNRYNELFAEKKQTPD